MDRDAIVHGQTLGDGRAFMNKTARVVQPVAPLVELPKLEWYNQPSSSL